MSTGIEQALDEGRTVAIEVDGPLFAPGSRGGTLRLSEQASAAVREEDEYRSFAASLGLADDEPKPLRLVSLERREYDRLRADADRLPELLQESARPDVWSPEDEASYRAWARTVGLE